MSPQLVEIWGSDARKFSDVGCQLGCRRVFWKGLLKNYLYQLIISTYKRIRIMKVHHRHVGSIASITGRGYATVWLVTCHDPRLKLSFCHLSFVLSYDSGTSWKLADAAICPVSIRISRNRLVRILALLIPHASNNCY